MRWLNQYKVTLCEVGLHQGSAFLAHLALFFYGMALFLVDGDLLAMKIIREITEIFQFNRIIHEIWLFIILCLFFGPFRADPCTR
jgi:uncharacterized membrane protein